MAFHFLHDEAVDAGVRRIAASQLAEAVAVLTDPAAVASAAHEARKRCKKLRGLLRLVRGSFADYRVEQAATRDAAALLSPFRDQQAHLEALARLAAADPRRYRSEAFVLLEARLDAEHRRTLDSPAFADALDRAAHALAAQLQRIDRWTLSADGFAALADGLVHAYRQARDALLDVRRRPSAERFHELRKRIKVHRYHLELLRDVWRGPMTAAVDEAERLGEWLGELHDLHVLVQLLRAPETGLAPALPVTELVGALLDHTQQLDLPALALADRLLSETPSALRRRLGHWWQGWQSDQRLATAV